MPPEEPPAPIDPITAMAEAAAQLHELFVSFCQAGFTPEQALALTREAMHIGSQGGGSP